MIYRSIIQTGLIAGAVALFPGMASFSGMALAAGVSDYAAEERISDDFGGGYYEAEIFSARHKSDRVEAGRRVDDEQPELDSALRRRVQAQVSWRRCVRAFSSRKSAALVTCRQAAALDPENPYIWNSIGGLQERRKHRRQAQNAYLKMLKLATLQDNPTAQIIGLGNLANLSVKTRDCRRAAIFARKAVSLGRRSGREEWLVPVLNIQATCLSRKGDMKAAGRKLQTALKLAKYFDRASDKARTYTNIGRLNIKMGRLVLAEAAFKNSLRLATKTSSRVKMAEIYYRLAHISVLKKDLPIAENYLVLSLKNYQAARHQKGVRVVSQLIAKLSRKRRSTGRVIIEKRSKQRVEKSATGLKAWNHQRRRREFRIDGSAVELFEVSRKTEAE